MAHTLTGSVILPNDEPLAAGYVDALPVGIMPDEGGALLLPRPERYMVEDGTWSGTIVGGCEYKFLVHLPDGTPALPMFRAPVPAGDDPLTFLELYRTAFTYVPPGYTTEGLIDAALATALPSYQLRSERNEPDGYAGIGPDGTIPEDILPPILPGAGDMARSVYDPNHDGKVSSAVTADVATTVPWGGVTEKPTEFPPESHDHDDRYYTETQIDTALAGKADLVGGVIATAQLPAIAISDVSTVSSEAAMLALSAQRGDVAIRTDLAATFILAADDPTVLANWKQLPVPTDGVISVNGQSGVVALSAADVDAAPSTHASTHASEGSDPIAPADIGAVDTSTAQSIGGDKTFTGEVVGPVMRTYGAAGASVLTSYMKTTEGALTSFLTDVMTVGNSTGKKTGIQLVNNVAGTGDDYVRFIVLNRKVAQCNSNLFGGNSDYPDFWIENKLLVNRDLAVYPADQPSTLIHIPEGQTGDALRVTTPPTGTPVTVAQITAEGKGSFTGLNIGPSSPPASATATGTAGDLAYDADYVYVCVATNTWKRSALVTW